MNACTSACGFCGRCTPPWEEREAVENEPEDLDELRLQAMNEEIYEAAVLAWFKRTEPVTK